MELKLFQKAHNRSVPAALLLAVVSAGILETAGAGSWIPLALAGAVLPLLPVVRRKKGCCILLGILAGYGIVRFRQVLDGIQILANWIFRLSEESQAYVYTCFPTRGSSPGEAILFLSVLLGTLCALWGNWVPGLLCGAWIGGMAYFGITPGVVWLAAALFAGVLTALPARQRLFYGGMAAVLVIGIALACTALVPEPIPAISDLDEQLRDALSAHSFAYAQSPVPTQVPEPEAVPPPQMLQEQPDHGVQPKKANILFLSLAALTLALLFIPAVIRDNAAKRREKTREGLRAEDPAAAIRARYLYALRWREAGGNTVTIPAEVYAIWQEAAFSDHAMTEKQAQTVGAFMKETAETVWNQANRRQRMRIRYRLYL